MTAATLEKNLHLVTNTDGEQIAIQIDLKDEEVRQFFEDLFDTLDVVKVQDEPTRSFEEIRSEILENRKAVGQ